ncbi:MAG: hypothetical protein K2H46_03900 [Muribaculaceae bacterium]|nr:hypothetical protein [Muribaculaceae bacterium]
MNATESQKEIIKYLNALVNDFFGSIWVPVWAADHMRRAAAAIGLRVTASIYHEKNGEILIQLV